MKSAYLDNGEFIVETGTGSAFVSGPFVIETESTATLISKVGPQLWANISKIGPQAIANISKVGPQAV